MEEQSTCKVVDLLNVDPVRFDNHGGVMISYWHVGKPELPLVLSTNDAKELVERIVRCLEQQEEDDQDVYL